MLSSRYLYLHEALGLGLIWLNQNVKIIRVTLQAVTAPVRPKTIAIDTAQVVHTLSVSTHQARIAAIITMQTAKSATHVPETASEAIAKTPAKAGRAMHSDSLPRLDITIRSPEIMVVSIRPPAEDSLYGMLSSDNIDILPNNILAAIGLKPEQVYKTTWVKIAPVLTALPNAEYVRAELAEMQSELAVSQVHAVLFLSEIPNSSDMIGLMDELCGRRPYFVIPHLVRLLIQPQLKTQVW